MPEIDPNDVPSDMQICPQCVGRRDSYDCGWCGNKGMIPLVNDPLKDSFISNAPHDFYPLSKDICVCMKFRKHPIHSGTQKAENHRPMAYA